MAVTDISELRKKRQARKTRSLILRIFVVLLICGAALVIVFTRQMWYPYLNGIMSSIPEGASSDINLSDMGDGEFLIQVEGGMGYQLINMDNSLALLDDSKFHVYSADGRLLTEKQHTYANPILCVSGSKALIYDSGGTEFSLESKYKTVYSKTAEDVIYLAKLSPSDHAAVVTRSDKFLAKLKVYNPSGNEIFTYYSYDSRIINVTFNDSSSGCVVTVLTAEGGQLMSKMIRFDFTDTEPKWTSTAVPTLALDVRFTSDGGIIMIGDTMAAGFSETGELLSQYIYSDPIADFDTNGTITAVLTKNTDIRRVELITFTGSDCSSHVDTVLGENAGKVFADGTDAYILDGRGIEIYSSDGTKTGDIILEDDYEDIIKSGRYIYLMGYDTVSRLGL